MNKRADIIIILVVLIIGVLYLLNYEGISNLSGKYVSENKYSLYVNKPISIDGRLLNLVKIGDNKELVIDVDGKKGTISQFGDAVLLNGLQIERLYANPNSGYAVVKILPINKFNLKIGESIIVGGRKVTVRDIGVDGYVKVDVNGVVDIVSKKRKTVNYVSIEVLRIDYTKDIKERSAQLRVKY